VIRKNFGHDPSWGDYLLWATQPSRSQAMHENPKTPELADRDLEQVQAGKGGNSNGSREGDGLFRRMRVRLLDNISIHLVDA